eukprot:14204941-Heterocapsa_arctica.AAC.1
MYELDQISIERTYCRNHGVAWNNRYDNYYARQRGLQLPPTIKYINRTRNRITWTEYFSAAAGLPSGAPQKVRSQFSSNASIISYKGPVPQAWTDYCLVMGGHWAYASNPREVLPHPNTWTPSGILELHQSHP